MSHIGEPAILLIDTVVGAAAAAIPVVLWPLSKSISVTYTFWPPGGVQVIVPVEDALLKQILAESLLVATCWTAFADCCWPRARNALTPTMRKIAVSSTMLLFFMSESKIPASVDSNNLICCKSWQSDRNRARWSNRFKPSGIRHRKTLRVRSRRCPTRQAPSRSA